MDKEIEKEFKEVYARIMDLHEQNGRLTGLIGQLIDLHKENQEAANKLRADNESLKAENERLQGILETAGAV